MQNERKMTEYDKCELYIRVLAQRFVNKAKSGKYALEYLADEYRELIWDCRFYYGICPNETANLYERLPEKLQDKIAYQYQLECEKD